MANLKILAAALVWLVLALAGCATNADTAARLNLAPTQKPTESTSNFVPYPETPAPQVVTTATPLPPPQRPIYVIDPNDGQRISRILVIDPDHRRHISSFLTRYLPDLVLSTDGRQVYIADTYWTQMTRGDVKDVISVYEAFSGRLLVDDLPIPGRARYKVYPLGKPNLFLSDDGRYLFSKRYGNTDPHQSRLAILDAEDLEVRHEGPWPDCGHRVQVLAAEWLCANTLLPREIPAGPVFSVSLSLDVVDPWAGTKLETLLTVEDLKTGLSGLASTPDGNWLYVVDRETGVTRIDIPNRRVVGQANLEGSEESQLIFDAVAATPDGRRLFLGFATGESRYRALVTEIWVYDTETWEPLTKIQMRDPVMHFTFSAEGDHLYAVSPGGQSLTIYDANTYREIATLGDLGGTPAKVVVPGAGG